MWTRRLRDADASCGGKAHGLARLIAVGLRVPEGFVVEDRAFRAALGDLADLAIESRDAIGHGLAEAARRIESVELPAELVHEVESAGRALGGRLAVRSSASIEDGEAGAAAGVFSSRTAVPIEDLWPAIRAVWASALTPLAASYARRRDATISISVIVQRFVEGEPIVVYTRPPGSPAGDEIWVQRHGRLIRTPRNERSPMLDAEIALGTDRGVDVELVVPRDERGENDLADLDLEHAWFVQARPIVHPVVKPRMAPPPMVLAALDDGRTWTLDVTHNPDPLSTAQIGLVERVERAGAAPWSARVCAGYLYTSIDAAPVVGSPILEPARDAPELLRRFNEISVRLDEILHRDGVPSLGDAIDRFVAFVRVWANEMSPLIAAARRGCSVSFGTTGDSLEGLLVDLAQLGDREVGDGLHRGIAILSPAWDVAVPTFGERPGLLRDAIARLRIARAQPRERPIEDAEPEELVRSTAYQLAMMGAHLAEIDDQWFARAQWLVRQAILARATELGLAPDDAFWLPLDALVAGVDPVDASRRASGARAAAARASHWNMPIVVGGEPKESGVALHGIGFGPKVTGRVRRFDSLASAIVVGRGEIVVTRAVTPALAVIVVGCAAIVSETGGLLDHGAAMARELGIPCVVGCRDAWSRLADGMIVTVENGTVVPIATKT